MTKVHCTVSNCEYHADSNFCGANEILIGGKPLTQERLDHHGHGTEDHAPTPAERSDGTLCYTFEPEG